MFLLFYNVIFSKIFISLYHIFAFFAIADCDYHKFVNLTFLYPNAGRQAKSEKILDKDRQNV